MTLFESKKFCTSASPIIFLCRNTVSFSDNVKYVEIKLNALSSDKYVSRQSRTIYCTAKKFKISFSQCSTSVVLNHRSATIYFNFTL